MASAAAPFLDEVAKPVLKKVFSGKRRRRWDKKIGLRRWVVPLNVTLPNGTSFAARHKRISRKNLPGNIRVTKTETIGLQKRRTKKKKVRFALANTATIHQQYANIPTRRDE